MKNETFSYEIVEHICVLTHNPSGWKKELNLVSWNGNPPKYDVRDWDPMHKNMSRGMTLTSEEMKKIVDMTKGREDILRAGEKEKSRGGYER